MKALAVILAVAVLAQAADIPRRRDVTKLRPRGELFPRPVQPQGPGYFTPVKQAHTVDMRNFCGQIKSSDRIVGGTEATPHEFPWQVALTIDGGSFCGGSLISPDWVLTAAHCADGARFFNVLLGAHDRTVAESSQVDIRTTTYTVHPGWNPNTLANDIALIRLPSPVSFTPEIAPICIAPASEPSHVGDTMLVSGWGKTQDGILQGVSPTLNKVEVPGITTAECAAVYGEIITYDILCVDTTGGHGSCNGDSGGPLSFDNNGVRNQVGIVSFGASAGCQKGFPAGFTRVSSHTQWISDVTGLLI